MSDIYIGPIEAERKRAKVRRKLAVLWTVYAMIVGGLTYFALWVGDFRWNSEATIASFVIVTAPLSVVTFIPFLRMHRLIMARVERWGEILRYGVPVGSVPDMGSEYVYGITDLDGSYIRKDETDWK
jgi:hypothetical protein